MTRATETTKLGQSLEICVPDIGDFDEVEVVELLVVKGDTVEFDDPLVSVESDKATMEIPSTAAGTVIEVRVSEGDKVSEGSVLVVLEPADGALAAIDSEAGQVGEESADAAPSTVTETAEVPAAPTKPTTPTTPTTPTKPTKPTTPTKPIPPTTATTAATDTADSEAETNLAGSAGEVEPKTTALARTLPTRELSEAARHPVPDREGLSHASPLARRYARELGVPLDSTTGSGAHGRVLIDDLNQKVRERFASEDGTNANSAETAIPAVPIVDHGAFGPVHDQPLTRIQKVSGPVLHRSWLNVPHVTQYDDADVTELERFRRDRRPLASERGVKLSPLLFVMKAVAVVLGEFPTFRSSLAPEADRLIVKDYFHLGIAVDTDQGLVVPVIRDVDRKGIFELASEISETAERARARKLTPDDLKGACFTISSLGGIGGTAFSPIVNAPEVAILGLSKTRVQPLWNGPSPLDLNLDPDPALDLGNDGVPQADRQAGAFEPRLVLPFSLSYDHRVIDGANAARFTSRLSRVLSDPLQLLL